MSLDDLADRRSYGRAAPLTLFGWVVGLVVTALVLWSPHVLFGYRSPAVHLVVDTVDACVALLVAYLLAGRFKRRRRLRDLLLAQGLVLLAVAGTGMSWLTESLSGNGSGGLDVWLPLALRIVGSVLVAAAALVSPGREVPPKSSQRTVLIPAVIMVLKSVAMSVGQSHLPMAVDRSVDAATQPELLAVHPLFLTAQCVSALCFFIASIGFTKRAADSDDPLLHWLGPACAVAGFARVNYALFPSLYTDWFYTGDLLRTGFYFLLLIGAGREIRQYWDSYSRWAVLEDRRRLSRELHDGVIQELVLGWMPRAGSSLPAIGHWMKPAQRSMPSAMAQRSRWASSCVGLHGSSSRGTVCARTSKSVFPQWSVPSSSTLCYALRARRWQMRCVTAVPGSFTSVCAKMVTAGY